MRLTPLAVTIVLAGCSEPAPAPAPAPTVLVTTVAPARGTLPDWLTVYGSAAPSANATQTLSAAQPGQVARVAVLPGAVVRAGQSLVVFATAPAARSNYEQAVTTLSTAAKQRTTTAQLLGQQLATRDQLAQAEKAVADAQAALDALRRDGADAAVRTLVAPFDGIVTTVSVATGDRTQPGAPLVTVARRGSIVVTAGVDPQLRQRVRLGAAVRLEPLGGGAALPGRVLRMSGALNPRTRLVDVDIAMAPGVALSGEAMRVQIRAGEAAGWLVPHRAVVTAEGAARVFQVATGKAVAVPVRIVLTTATTDVVEGGIVADRPLIVDGAYQVETGGAVRTATHR